MRKLALWGPLLCVAFGGLVALPLAFASGDRTAGRSDCPGTVICPLSGEEVCKDRCPLGAVNVSEATATARPDCPGTVACPLTGEEVCKDRCPLGAATAGTAAAEAADDLPTCCRKLKK